MPPSTPQNADQDLSHPKQRCRVGQQHSRKNRTSNPFATSSRKQLRSTTHSKLSSKSVTPQDNSTNLTRSYKHSDIGFHSIPSNSPSIEQGIGSTFQDAHHFTIGGNARIVNIGQQNVNNRGTYGMHDLKEFVSFSALHDSSAQDPERCCHPGTRQNVLARIHTWIDDPNTPERISWLYGPAGVGKSAIAQTISFSYHRDTVGATFFFFRSDPIRNDGNRLIPTLAWQLASSVPIVKDVMASSLEEYPDLPRKAVEIQFNQLITQPFLTIYNGESTVSMRVIIIDGLDECSDVKLQDRILKAIGSTVANTRFPLRFLISSRPEAHIHDFFEQYQHPTLQIDLGNVDEAYRDIEKYLISEFARIAVEQELDPRTWPGQRIIDTLVSKSSGQFVYASTVIKYVGDKYESAIAQLNVILGLKPSTGKSPFSELDALYIEILKRQPDQEFLREFLAVLVAISMLTGMKGGDLHEDDAMLLGLDEKQLHRKLRGMRSLLKFKPSIDVHHKSFLDFLDESSRSDNYHVSKNFANRRYMELITDALIKAAPRAMEQPNSHTEVDHFKPRFATVIKRFPLCVQLPLGDLEEILRPLRIIQENLLQLPNMSVPWKPKPCEKCWTLYMIDDLLLQLSLIRETTQLQEPKFAGICPLTVMEERRSIPQPDLDACLSLLLPNLRGVELSLNMDTIGLVRALVHFEPTDTAMKIRTVMDAQNLVDLIFLLNKNGCFASWFGVAASNATRLVLEIWGRVPVLPQSLCLNNADSTCQGTAIKTWGGIIKTIWPKCFDAFVWGSISHSNVEPFFGLCSIGQDEAVVSPGLENETLYKWRKNTNAPVSEYQRIAFEVAKAIQHIHTLGIVIHWEFDAHHVYLDSDNHAKVMLSSFRPNRLWNRGFDYDSYDEVPFTLEDNIDSFGLLLYEVLFNDSIYYIPKIRPKEPEIPDNVWQLIQWCCIEDEKECPTMDQVVQEMESWIALGQFTLSD